MRICYYIGITYIIHTTDIVTRAQSTRRQKVVAVKSDVTKEEDILSMMNAIKSQFGGADICINNAGLGHYATLLDGSSAMWKEMFEVRHYL